MDREILYTIGEVSKILGINSSKIRFWMKQFPDFLTCTYTQGGQRRFTYNHYLKLKKVKDLTDEEKLTLEGVKKRLLIEKSKKEKLRTLISKVYNGIRDGMSEEVLVEKLINTIF